MVVVVVVVVVGLDVCHGRNRVKIALKNDHLRNIKLRVIRV